MAPRNVTTAEAERVLGPGGRPVIAVSVVARKRGGTD